MNNSERGRSNKRRGRYYEKSAADFWSKELGIKLRATPRSGAFWDFPGDIMAMPYNENFDFVIDIKSGKTAIPKKLKAEMEKLDDDSQGKIHWLELVEQNEKNPLIVIRRNDFAKIIKKTLKLK